MNFMEAQTTKKCTAAHTKMRGSSLYETLNDEVRSKKGADASKQRIPDKLENTALNPSQKNQRKPY